MLRAETYQHFFELCLFTVSNGSIAPLKDSGGFFWGGEGGFTARLLKNMALLQPATMSCHVINCGMTAYSIFNSVFFFVLFIAFVVLI